MEQIKILTKTSFGYDGVAGVTMNYFKNMSYSNIKVDFLICNSSNIRKDFSDYTKSCGSRIFTLVQPNKHIFKYSKELCKILKEEKYKVIHINGNSGSMLVDVLLAKLCGVKVQITHSHNTSCRYKLLHYMLKPFLNALVKDKLACSEAAGKWLYNKNFKVIQNGINFDEYKYNKVSRDNIRSKYNITDEFVMCHVGSFIDTKNHTYLIDIFKEVTKINPKSRLLLIGDGPLKSEIKEKVIQNNLESQTIFVGNTTEVSKYYSASDVFVLPSKFEGLPLVLVESQVAGLPCIISDNITKDVDITGQVEQLSIFSNPVIWAEKIIDFFNNNSRESIKIKDNARAFDIKKNAFELEKFYIQRSNEEYSSNG